MTKPVRNSLEDAGPADAELDLELLRIIAALAESQARADYAARFPAQEQSA